MGGHHDPRAPARTTRASPSPPRDGFEYAGRQQVIQVVHVHDVRIERIKLVPDDRSGAERIDVAGGRPPQPRNVLPREDIDRQAAGGEPFGGALHEHFAAATLAIIVELENPQSVTGGRRESRVRLGQQGPNLGAPQGSVEFAEPLLDLLERRGVIVLGLIEVAGDI
jgi:hypothetical protein